MSWRLLAVGSHKRQDNYPGKIKRVKRIFQAEGAARNGQQF